jgi:signal transduction histidine kinase
MAEAKRLTLALDLPDAPLVFPTDPGKFRQIVFNLAANAVKFTKAGEVRLGLHEEAGTLVLRVSDTGIGISPEDAEHLFESYWQVRQSGSRYPGGTGLGLSITRQLAQLLGGDVSVNSRPGDGSTFIVRLPRPRVEGVEATIGIPLMRERRKHRRRDDPSLPSEIDEKRLDARSDG